MLKHILKVCVMWTSIVSLTTYTCLNTFSDRIFMNKIFKFFTIYQTSLPFESLNFPYFGYKIQSHESTI